MRVLLGLLAVVGLLVGCTGDDSDDDGAGAGASVGIVSLESESASTSDGGGTDSDGGGTGAGLVVASGSEPVDSGSGDDAPGLFETVLSAFSTSFGSREGDEDYDQNADLDGDGRVGMGDLACAKRNLAGLSCDAGGSGEGGSPPLPPGAYQAERPFSNSAECKFCHPRQFNEWRTSPHAYTGISPTFYSLVAAGQNSFGAGVLVNQSGGVSQAGGVGNFCLPCHAPMAFIGLEGRYGGNNAGFADARPVIPFVCNPLTSPNAFAPCDNLTAAQDCAIDTNMNDVIDPAEEAPANSCIQFEGRTCVNMPPQNPNTLFPRRLVHCVDDSDCAAGSNGCPEGGDDCGPCVIAPTTAYYFPEAQEGINCESCHNMQPNHQRSCQLFRNSDSAGVLSIDITERTSEDDRRLRLAAYPLANADDDLGCAPGSASCVGPDGRTADDTVPPVRNAFHESARVDTPLVVPYDQTDRRGGVQNPQASINIVRPTQLTCEELPYCFGPNPTVPGSGVCQGGPVIGNACNNDGDCGGCFQGQCGAASPRGMGFACETSVDCGVPSNTAQNILDRAIDDPNDETVQPLARTGAGGIDQPDGNFYRSSMFCASCHDVRPPFVNAVLKSCQEQDSHVCNTDADCVGLGIGCSGGDCGPCVAENASAHLQPNAIAERPAPAGRAGADAAGQTGDPRNFGYRRVENLFSEWQISLYNHPELSYCQRNTFISCQNDADCMAGGEDEGPCSINPQGNPIYGKIVTCQDCHMSNFPETPLIDYPNGVNQPGVVLDRNALYPKDLAALEGSQENVGTPLPVRRVSTHFMSGVDLPLVKYPGQSVQAVRRQQLIDSGFKIQVIDRPTQPVAGQPYHVEVSVENVGVGHRFPAGFSHERQNWMQVFVQDRQVLQDLGILDDPFAPEAPCHLQRTIATSAEDARDPVGATQLRLAGCVFRSGFQLDKAHPETGEMVPDGSLHDEDPEDFYVAVGTRVLPNPGQHVRPGTAGRALSVQYICAEETEQTYRAAIAAGSGIDTGTNPAFPFQARLCDPAQTPASGPGHTAPGFGNPDCMEGAADVGPCVPEIELSDGNERGRCAGDIARPSCQSDEDCGNDGPCLYRCSGFPELECCDETDPTCAAYYTDLFGSANHECELETQGCSISLGACLVDGDCPGGETCEELEACIGGSRSGLACNSGADCPGSGNCGDAGQCRIENTGIVNFQNQFRTTANGVCVDPATPRDPQGRPIPLLSNGQPVSCFLDLTCTLNGLPNAGSVCLVNGQCGPDSPPAQVGAPCTNVTYASDCGGGTCNVEFNLELNGRPSESVFLQNHPFNFNSMAPFQPRVFEYDFEVPSELEGRTLVVSARLMNRHFPMRFLRNLIGTQTIRPPFVFEGQGDPSNPNECSNPRSIDIDCFVAPVSTLGNAEPGGYVPPVQTVRMQEIVVQPAP